MFEKNQRVSNKVKSIAMSIVRLEPFDGTKDGLRIELY